VLPAGSRVEVLALLPTWRRFLLVQALSQAVVGLAAAIVAIWQRPGGAGGGRSGRPDLLLRLGEASFGVYLCWVFIEVALVGVLRVVEPGAAGRVLLMAAGFAANLAAGWLAWRLVEVPAHRWILERAEPRARLDPARSATR